MNREDAQGREIQALRDRLARLSEVSLRINESLELGDRAGRPRYLFTEPRVGCRMPRGETEEG